MTLDDLIDTYNHASTRGSFIQFEGIDKRAGIRAVVEAIRYEIGCTCSCTWFLDDILGGAGEKAAGGPRPTAMGSTPPAADPSPEVCEWTLIATSKYGGDYELACGGIACGFSKNASCPSCGKPIVFKEPKP